MKEQIKSRLDRALRDLYGITPSNYKVEKPRDEKLGDLATNVAFLLAKETGRNPQEIAQELARRLSEDEGHRERGKGSDRVCERQSHGTASSGTRKGCGCR